MKKLAGAIRLNFGVRVWHSPVHAVSVSIQVTKHTCLWSSEQLLPPVLVLVVGIIPPQ